MPRTEKYFVGPKLLDDIREVITRVNGQPDKTSGPHFNAVHQDMPRPGGKAIRLCSWTATWYDNATTLVTFSNSGGATATAINVFYGVGPGGGWVAKDAGVWKLVSAKLSDQPGHDPTEIQLLGHNSIPCPDGVECSGADRVGTLEWYSVTACQ